MISRAAFLAFVLPFCAAIAFAAEPEVQWTGLFDGKTLGGWKKTNFGGETEITVKDGVVHFDMGYPLTGLTYNGKLDLPRTDYELSVEAQRVDGSDFFCGLTFPVGKSYCSFIPGGWGGTTTGLSSINDLDAAHNNTTKYIDYKQGKWYKIVVRVTDEKIKVWLDKEVIIDREIKGEKVGLRNEVSPSRPLGLCSFETKAAIRNLQIRRLDGKKIAEKEKPDDEE